MPYLLPLVAAATFSSVAAQAPASAWEIHPAANFCYMWMPATDAGGTEFGLALDLDEQATIILANRQWGLAPEKKYSLTAAVDSPKKLKARGLKISTDMVALAAPVDSGFVKRLASAPAIQFRFDERNAEGMLPVGAAGPAIAAVRSCVTGLKSKALELAKYKAEREVTFRSDPQGHQDPGAPPEDGGH